MTSSEKMLENLKKSLSEATDDELTKEFEELKGFNCIGPSMEEILRDNQSNQ